MRFVFVILAALWCQLILGQSAAAQSVVESRETNALGLTVYPNNLAMVTEVRTVDVPKGISEIRFHGVTDLIVPETAVLQSFEGLRLEGNFNSDLISRAALLKNAVGERVTIRRLNPGTGKLELMEAELVSASSSNYVNMIQGAVFKTDDGFEALQCSGLPEAILFSKLPKNLNPIPMLSMTVSAEQAGPKDITLTYLTRGIGWEADYRMDVNPREEGATLLGWLTLTNDTSKRFQDAELAVVAGRVNRAQLTPSLPSNAGRFLPTCGDSVTRRSRDEIAVTAKRSGYLSETVVVQEASTELITMDGVVMERAAPAVVKQVSVRAATREELGDYKLYRAPQSVTLSAHQTKQIAFLLKPDIEFERVHKRNVALRRLTTISTHLKPSDVEYEIDNSLKGSLAQPLPKGTLRLMSETENGQTLFSGEGPVENLAVDLPFDVKLAESFLVTNVFGYDTVESAEGLILKLSVDVQNATGDAILAEVEFSDLQLDVIGGSNVERDTEEALPTYRFPVDAESNQTVVLDIPIEERGIFVHNPNRYRDTHISPRRYVNSIPISIYRFRGHLENEKFLSALIKRNQVKSVQVIAKELSVKTLKNQIEEREEKFVFKNSYGQPLDFTFRHHVRSGRMSLLESSIAPDSENPILWNLTVPANSELVLRTTTRAEL